MVDVSEVYGGDAASGWSDFVRNTYRDQLNAGLIQPGREREAALDAFRNGYNWLADRAEVWSTRLAHANGDLAEKIRQGKMDNYAAQANRLNDTLLSTRSG